MKTISKLINNNVDNVSVFSFCYLVSENKINNKNIKEILNKQQKQEKLTSDELKLIRVLKRYFYNTKLSKQQVIILKDIFSSLKINISDINTIINNAS